MSRDKMQDPRGKKPLVWTSFIIFTVIDLMQYALT
ncbi:hypothetical protein Tgr7_1971 [Thioalkalivibrio sulfidiphilus HL-EbGr7]|uniref:Uncharacterized protein n=1 Tax=Thioalkalivibrio sulfidiphilus (strain HL-EbGR7) TaxID=396588 RepID=B8GT37_THISH|nr:hypothetical protein Tgr7_1971 [Thioalkalivibrio sulfidiphilus HL-EbGr7]